jgi:hypothetical protein
LQDIPPYITSLKNNMQRVIISVFAAFLLLLMMPSMVFGQRSKLPQIKPVLGYAPDISANAKENHARLMAEYDAIDSTISTYPYVEAAFEHLTPRQIEIWNNRFSYHRNDHLNIKTTGCSWYCSGGPDSIYATSMLPATEETGFSADNAHDFYLGTAWVAKGGVGERITYRFSKKSPAVSVVTIFNGHQLDEQLWKDHARAKQLKVSANGKPVALLQLQDVTSMQTFQVGPFKGNDAPLELSFEVTEVYPGERFGHVAISELHFDGERTH